MPQSVPHDTHLRDVIRDAIAAADALSLHDSVWNAESVARPLEALRASLAAVERALVRQRVRSAELDRLQRAVGTFDTVAERVSADVRARVRILLGRARRIEERLRAMAVLAQRARGMRHAAGTALEYGAAAGCVAAGLLAASGRARGAGVALGAAGAVLAVCGDERVGAGTSAVRDAVRAGVGVLGVAAAVAPFALGYYRRDPATAAVHVAAGVGALLGAVLRR
jgi:hypothetical protein